MLENRGDDPARWRDREYPTDYSGQVQKAISFSGVSHDFFIVGKAKWIERFFEERHIPYPMPSILDIGCGVGLLHAHLGKIAQHIVGIDLSEQALETARQRNPQNTYLRYPGGALPFDDARFDMALAVTVMHHVPLADWQQFVDEAARVLKPGGMLAVIEHNPFNPLTRLSVNRCEFDNDAVLLSAGKTRRLLKSSGFREIGTEFIFFTPFKSRWARTLESLCRSIPLGAQYVTYGFK